MLKCVCCKNHVHLVLGDKDNIYERHPTQFGWPLYSQDIVRFAEKELLQNIVKSEEDRQDVRDCLVRVYARINKQQRDTKGRFAGPFLPETDRGISTIDYVSLLKNWIEFTEEKTNSVNYILDTLLGPYVAPVRNCSLIRYISSPPQELKRFESPVWEGVFELSDHLEVI